MPSFRVLPALALLLAVLAPWDEAARPCRAGDETPDAAFVRLAEALIRQPDDDPLIPSRIARAFAAHPDRATWAVNQVLQGEIEPEEARRFIRLAADARLVGLADMVGALRYALGCRDVQVREEAARAVRLLDLRDQTPAFLGLLTRDPSAPSRAEIVTTLAHLLERDAFRDLLPTLQKEENGDVRRRYVVQLSEFGDDASVPALAAFVRDADWRVASAALVAIGTLGTERDLPILLPPTAHADWRIRGAAYKALGRLHVAKALPTLARGLRDPDALVRDTCLEQLRRLTGKRLRIASHAWLRWIRGQGTDLHLVARGPVERPVKEAASRHLGEGERERLRWFVNVGGVLKTQGRALTTILEPCFPGFLEGVPDATPTREIVAVDGGRLEEGALPFAVPHPTRCEVLVTSAAMRKRTGSSLVVATFRWGLGRVEHTAGRLHPTGQGGDAP